MSISEKNKLEWEGKICTSNNAGDFKILEYKDTNHVLIEFLQTGYKKAKEQCIKEYAEKYKGQITDEVYDALLNYKVEITD